MVFTVQRRAFALAVVFAVSAVFPLGTSAAGKSISEIVNGSAQTVSRTEFLRWSVELLGIPAKSDCTLDYQRVPDSMRGVLCAAQGKKALEPLGPDLQLAQPITRGEALLVLTALTGKTSQADVSKFKDVKTDAMKRAVANAVGHRWMNPLSDTSFGVARRLSGAEALSTLSSVTGKAPARQQTNTNTVRIRIQSPQNSQTPVTTSTSGVIGTVPESSLLMTVWQLIQRDYLRTEGLNQKEMGYATIEGLMKGLGDPYSTFMRPAQASNFQTQIKGELSGIGAHVEDRDGTVVIVAPLPGTPAEKAGLKTGDQILEADGVVLTGIGLERAIEHIRGSKGSTVKLRIRRGTDDFVVSVKRDNISIPEVEITWRGNVAVVKIVQFGQTTDSKIRDVMRDIAAQKPRGIVLDLRNNPGGLLHAATVVVSNFVPSGTVVAQVRGRSSTTNEVTQEDPTVPDTVKLSVLVNEGSASASEIVAGALQDHKRAKIIGTKTFGKGTVQELLSFTSGEALKLTIAEWLTPGGRTIDKVGITPDVVVENADQQLQRAMSEVQ